MPDVKLSQLAAASAASVAAGAGLWTMAGHILGLRMEYVGPASIRVSSGSAWIPSLQQAIEVPSALTLSGLTLAANTWYHLYLYLNGLTPAIEAVTDAPAAPYSGTARAKTGAASRRYVGSFRTDAGGVIAKFKHIPAAGAVVYLGIRPLSLNAGVSTTTTSVSLGAAVPTTAAAAALIISLDAAGAALFTGNSEMPDPVLSNGNFLGYTESSTQVSVSRMDGHPVDANQSISYRLSQTPSSGTGAYVRVMAYTYER
ncbi:hypothetical protein [Stenotrophomonas maltophilia]|uniref:hypothetical protein n=1 Tax=Stenotrophomonas maltophilia TaxID=40324 RepID=UPI0039C19B85